MPTGPRAPLSCCQVKGPSGCALEVGLSGPGQGPTGEGHAVLVAGGAEGTARSRRLGIWAWVQQGLKTETERGCRREVWEGSWRQAEGPVLVGDTQRCQTIPPSLPRADKKEATSGGVSNGAIVGAGISALSFCLCLILVM